VEAPAFALASAGQDLLAEILAGGLGHIYLLGTDFPDQQGDERRAGDVGESAQVREATRVYTTSTGLEHLSAATRNGTSAVRTATETSSSASLTLQLRRQARSCRRPHRSLPRRPLAAFDALRSAGRASTKGSAAGRPASVLASPTTSPWP
jgi:hypothetical protein